MWLTVVLVVSTNCSNPHLSQNNTEQNSRIIFNRFINIFPFFIRLSLFAIVKQSIEIRIYSKRQRRWVTEKFFFILWFGSNLFGRANTRLLFCSYNLNLFFPHLLMNFQPFFLHFCDECRSKYNNNIHSQIDSHMCVSFR